jgi:hypothetical protein
LSKQYAKAKMGLGDSPAVTTCQPPPSGLLGIPICGLIGILERMSGIASSGEPPKVNPPVSTKSPGSHTAFTISLETLYSAQDKYLCHL